ncbi:phage tail protein [uncultured Desulfosarcina sp.]|uniref:phage tail protein n=1 Tax=uncultured Desulfosarcina sp. TaxID=218289 RepID=UPI0029C65EA8|nr:phage tail protein [uncultured Desulfosarcina sp.]
MGFAQVKLSESDLNDAKRALIGIENGFPRAFARALNKSVAGVRTDMVSLAREDYNFKAAAVRKRISIHKAYVSRLTAKAVSVGPGVHLTDFVGTRQTNTGLSVDVKKSTGRKAIRHGFLNKSPKSGKLLAMRRATVNGRRVPRYPIETLYGPHPEVVYNTGPNWAKLQKSADERLNKNFAHEIDVLLKGVA